ncbi:MAG: C25 family cysteine peptidase, partial [Candidatus Zixiibacteriota bacterium]
MSRIPPSILATIFATLLLFPFSSRLSAGVAINVSNERELALSWNSSVDAGQALASGATAQATSLIVGDSIAIDAQVICFWAPTKQVRLTRGELTFGKQTTGATNIAGIDFPISAQLVEPVQIRGRWFGKVVVPMKVFQGGAWFEVSSANIAVSFDGAVQSASVSNGALDRVLDDLAVNSGEAEGWYARAAAPVQANIYNPFAQSTNWLRMAITQSGIHKISRSDLSGAGVNVGALDPRTIRLFHAGGRPLPLSNSGARDSLAEMAITVIGEDDGALGDQDFVMFYANGTDFNTWNGNPDFMRHPYSDRNVYYLTFGGSFTDEPKRMATQSGDVSGAVDTLTRFVDYLHFEEDVEFEQSQGDIFDYYNWYWGLAGDMTLFINLPQPTPLSVNHFRLKTTRPSQDPPPFTIRVNNFEVTPDSTRAGFYYYTTDRLAVGLNQIGVDYGPFGLGYTDKLFVSLQRALTLPASGELLFTGAGDGNVHAYKMTGQFATPYLLDVSDVYNQRVISPATTAGQMTFSALANASLVTPFAIANAAALKTPQSIVATQVDDIKAASNGADYIVLTHDNFYNSALEYAAYRQQHDNLRVRVVKISDVYAQFSGGRLDPVAIRDFLRHSYNNWSGAKPSFCLLVGDGVFDFRNNLGAGGVNYIPPFIVDNDETVSDENFVFLDSLLDLDSDNSYPTDRGVDMVIARWPVKTTAEFQAVFDKMKRYESGDDAGSWRNMITLIADDENHPQSSAPEIFHTQDTEELATTIISPNFVLDKIYGISYPFGAAAEKPEMREDIIRAINEGRLIVNYTGHGNPNLWADERIFRRTQDIPRLSNLVRLPLIFNASCSIGFFDDPRSEGMAEDLLRYTNGGAVGTISATRLVYARPNFQFNKAGLTQLLGDNNYTVAEAVYVTKLLRQGEFGVGDNDRKYIYIGDPLTRLAVAPNRIHYTTLAPDSLVALTVTELAGQIEDQDGVKQTGFDGTATISVFDNSRERSVTIPYFDTQFVVS